MPQAVDELCRASFDAGAGRPRCWRGGAERGELPTTAAPTMLQTSIHLKLGSETSESASAVRRQRPPPLRYAQTQNFALLLAVEGQQPSAPGGASGPPGYHLELNQQIINMVALLRAKNQLISGARAGARARAPTRGGAPTQVARRQFIRRCSLMFVPEVTQAPCIAAAGPLERNLPRQLATLPGRTGRNVRHGDPHQRREGEQQDRGKRARRLLALPRRRLGRQRAGGAVCVPLDEGAPALFSALAADASRQEASICPQHPMLAPLPFAAANRVPASPACREERYCRFCEAELPDWRDASAGLPMARPVMIVMHQGVSHQVSVSPGADGAASFQVTDVARPGPLANPAACSSAKLTRFSRLPPTHFSRRPPSDASSISTPTMRSSFLLAAACRVPVRMRGCQSSGLPPCPVYALTPALCSSSLAPKLVQGKT
jgi:hypothetical protein